MVGVGRPIHARIDALLPLLRQFPAAEYGIALGGAHAKSMEDAASDLDLYIFSAGARPAVERERLTRAFNTAISDIVAWDAATPFEQGGTDFTIDGLRVETWYRARGHIEQTIADCIAGRITTELVTWTPSGFYNYCTLSDLKSMVIVDDPAGMIAAWKAAIASYPPQLKAAIAQSSLTAAGFWPWNFHYSSAVERVDVIYTSSIVQQVAHNLIQAVFALNEVYFPGDKKLALALTRLTQLPERFVERVTALLHPAEPASAGLLRAQQTELQQLVDAVRAMARASGLA